MRRVPWWGVLSSAAAPALLVGGWTLAAALQPAGFDPRAETISALAAEGAAESWVMTVALLGVGVCHLATAAALRPAARSGRLLLAVGGGGTVLVALTPLPPDGGSAAHTLSAAIAFTALAAWPAGAWQRGPAVPWGLRRPVAAGAAAVLLVLLGWFAVLLLIGGGVGRAERVAAAAQAIWPGAVVLSARLRSRWSG